MNTRMRDHDDDLLGHGDRLDPERLEVNPQRMASLSEQGNRLVHTPGECADVALCEPRLLRQFATVPGRSQRQEGSDDERGRG